MTYFYDAAGSKRRKEVYTEGIKTSVLDYAGSVVYRDDAPSYAVFEEGRILINPEETNFIEYHLKDHLGNVRVAYKEDNGLPVALQTNTYYPFGMLISELSTPDLNCPNPLKYNAKELQPDFGLDWYDYGARFYDPQVGRWWGVDPLAEKSRRWSPYHYCMNNPIRFIDPDGMDVFHSKALGSHWADDLVQDHSYQELLQSTMASNDEAAEKESSADEFSPQDGSQTEMNAGNGGGGDKKKKRSSASSTGGNPSAREGSDGVTFAAALGMAAVALSPEWTASSSVPVWGQVAMSVATIATAAYIHANSKSSQKPNIVYEIYSFNLAGYYQTMKYGVSSRSDFVTRTGNPRPEYQCVALNSIAPPGVYYWYSILARTPDRASALSIEQSYVRAYQAANGGLRPPLQIRP
ncbi:MAG TPA: RHS repeat-associated core domain-containing protein [Bacteroidales bacterium]|nr:RHS repeat-associated core domain-containing protein [Bacteroidales bacterium]